MTGRLPLAALCAAALLWMAPAGAAKPEPKDGERFGVIGHSFARNGGDERLRQSIEDVALQSPAFVVVTGIKAEDEPCTDKLYIARRKLIADAKRPMIVMPAASDWAGCRNSNGRTSAVERLNRIRELYYPEPESLGRRRIELTRQSFNTKFRSYAENAYWISGNVMYATVNLPGNNNHYRPEAGRNSEYEDRLVANRFWLNRVFALARSKKLGGVVLFSEGAINGTEEEKGLRALLRRERRTQDGFEAPRRQVAQLARKFRGKVLLVDTSTAADGAEPVIQWQGNVGHVSAGTGALVVHVSGDLKFAVTRADPDA